MANEATEGPSERPPLTIVDAKGSPKEAPETPVKAPQKHHSKRSVKRKGTPNGVLTLRDLTSIEADVPDGAAARSDRETEIDRRALVEFRILLRKLASRGRLESSSRSDPPKLSRNPFAQVRRFFEQEPEFEDVVGDYASLLPVLEAPSGMMYSRMALIGIEALQARRIGISKAIYTEIRYRTSASAALTSVMKGVRFFVFVLAALCGLVPAALFIIFFKQGGYSWQDLANLPYISPTVLKVGVAAFFGCLGSVVSLLLRLSEFESTKGRSKEFLFLYGSTLPIIGAIFAVVTATLLGTGVINVGEGYQPYMVLGFLSGFSERFTRNLLDIAEDQLSPSRVQSGRRKKKK